MSINESSMWAAVHRMESASEQIARAAEEITQAVQRFAFLLEPGYGGNGLRLIELLEQSAPQPQQSAHVSVPRELLEDLRDCANECYNHARFRGTSGLDTYERLTEEADALLNGGEA